MKKVILGATGSIGSSLAKKLAESGEELHLVGRDESSLSALANELNSTFTVCDVLEENFSEKILADLKDEQINGLAFCVGSIDLKPLKLTKKSDYMQCFNLNLISATEIIRACHDKLKQNKGVGYARNVGARLAKNEILCYIDSDLILPWTSLTHRPPIKSIAGIPAI